LQEAHGLIEKRTTKEEFEDLHNFVQEGTFKQDEAAEQFEEVDVKLDELRNMVNKAEKGTVLCLEEKVYELNTTIDFNF